MPDKSAIKVSVKGSGTVGITGLNPASGYPLGRGLAQKMLTADSPDTFIPASLLHDYEGRLKDELVGLYDADLIDIEIDGVGISSSAALETLSEPSGLERAGEVFIAAHPNSYSTDQGTWTDDYSSQVFSSARTAADTADTVIVPIPALYLTGSNGSGRRPTGVRLYYSIATAVLDDDLTIQAYTHAPPATGSAMASGTAIHTNGSYDSAHDTAGERVAVGDHTLEFTFDADDVDYLESGEGVTVEVTVDCSSGSTSTAAFTYKGISFLYNERPGPGMDDAE